MATEDITTSIQKAMNDVRVEGLVCLEAGTGAGNTTCYLAARGAGLVYSVSNEQEHLDYARNRLSDEDARRVEFVKADLRKLDFLSERTIDLITAHMLINVLPPVDLFLVFKELSRVAKENALLLVNDYEPLSSHCAGRSHLAEELFRIENAASYLIRGEPALAWYPSGYVTDLLRLLEWEVESVKSLYDRTPWEKELLQEHVDDIKEMSLRVDDEGTRKALIQRALDILDQIGDDEVIYAGSIYSVKAWRK
jgi:ubiquinone/menaquinone biosynthesis C-methylase UbiE